MHEIFMKQALSLASKGRYTCRPNPMVGAVIVDPQGQVIAEGYHKVFGGPHAEIEALSALPKNSDLSRCTIYVTLEPCSHYGKTPPCCEALIARKFGRVVVGSADPNPLVAGKGLAALKASGIEVIEGVLKKECDALNEIFFKYITGDRPFVTLKGAITLDGYIAANSGQSTWVSGEESRRHAQGLRAWNMAIMAGIGTVLADNPRLTCRVEGLPSPIRVIADSKLNTPPESALFEDTGTAPLIIACLQDAPEDKKEALIAKGAEILPCPAEDGHISLPWLLTELKKRGIDSLLVEGGGTINNAFLRRGLADRLALYTAPKILGSGVPFVKGKATAHMDEALTFNFEKISTLGEDLLIEARLIKE